MRRSFVVMLLVLLLAPAIAAGGRAAGQGATTPVASPVADVTPVADASGYAWLELGPEGVPIARAVSANGCPDIVIDGTTYTMDLRAEPSEAHQMHVCETVLRGEPERVSVGDRTLPMPVDDPERILLIGDTGCRIKAADEAYQACNDPEAWPFAEVAVHAAAWQPDLIIHTGDYHYRESACPEGNTGCAGSPYGDTWPAWEADFFAPASPLLNAAPWIVMRGNHEDCERAGDGWFRYLDPSPMPSTCLPFVDPYALEIGGTTTVVMDAATAGDVSSDEETNAVFREQFAMVEELAGDDPAWLLTHRPFWSIADADGGAYTEWTTATYIGAGYDDPPAAIEVVISGHVHLAEVLVFTEESGRPVQLISGNGGTSLDWMETALVTGEDTGDPALVDGRRYQEFGFMGLERVDTGWVVTSPMLDGSNPVTCLMQGKAAVCLP